MVFGPRDPRSSPSTKPYRTDGGRLSKAHHAAASTREGEALRNGRGSAGSITVSVMVMSLLQVRGNPIPSLA